MNHTLPAPAGTPDFDSAAFHRFENDRWEQVGEAWHRHFSLLSIQAAEHLLDAARISARPPAPRVLDIATGPGYAAANAAARGAQVVGVDFAGAQIDVAQRLYPKVDFRVGDAEDLPFIDRQFDAVVINFGLLHFPDPRRALAEAYRVLRPGGRLAFTVWAEPARNTGFGLVEQAIVKHGVADTTIPIGPPCFQFADHAHCRRTLEDAGFRDSAVEDLGLIWRLDSPDELAPAIEHGTVRTGARLRAQPAAIRDRVEDAIVKEAARYRRGDRIELPMLAVLSAARKS